MLRGVLGMGWSSILTLEIITPKYRYDNILRPKNQDYLNSLIFSYYFIFLQEMRVVPGLQKLRVSNSSL